MMSLELLKTGFFGYQKSGVQQYVAKLHEEYQDRLVDESIAHEAAIKELKAQLEEAKSASEAALEALELELTDKNAVAMAECESKCNAETEKVRSECDEQIAALKAQLEREREEHEAALAEREEIHRADIKRWELQRLTIGRERRELDYESERLEEAKAQAQRLIAPLDNMSRALAAFAAKNSAEKIIHEDIFERDAL